MTFLYRSDLPLSPRHHASIASNNRSSETISSIMQTPIPSMILRDTSIREQSSSSIKDSQSSSYFRGSSYNTNNSSFNSYSSREPDCSSPFSGSNGSNNLSSSFAIPNNGQLSLGSKESSSIILRDNNVATIQHSSPRVASNRFLSGGLDTQRIIKQSSEDCRRLLQQVSFNIYKVIFAIYKFLLVCLKR